MNNKISLHKSVGKKSAHCFLRSTLSVFIHTRCIIHMTDRVRLVQYSMFISLECQSVCLSIFVHSSCIMYLTLTRNFISLLGRYGQSRLWKISKTQIYKRLWDSSGTWWCVIYTNVLVSYIYQCTGKLYIYQCTGKLYIPMYW